MPDATSYTKEALAALEKRHSTFVGVDSDGCVFDTMEIKQKQCFHGLIISRWGLEAIATQLREVAEFVNLYSKWRGQNRFIDLVKTFDLLKDHPGVVAAGTPVPVLASLKAFIDSGATLDNASLSAAAVESGDPELATLIEWSKAVNDEIALKVKRIPPFRWAFKSLQRIRTRSDAVCVSQTPTEALVREWDENDLLPYVRFIAGQELGTKAEHIAITTEGKYDASQILMIGDAPGDKAAADANNACFYPINPAKEEDSWERFFKEGYEKFLEGSYRGSYENGLIQEFESLLPETPPW